MLLSFIYFHRHCAIYLRSEGHRWAWGELCCCHPFIFNVNVSFISKVRALVGLEELCCCQSSVFDVTVPFISKVSVTGGFSTVCLWSAPAWVVAVLQVELFINLQPFLLLRRNLEGPAHMFQFSSAWGLNEGRYVCKCSMHPSDPPGAMALQMLPLPHSCVCKRRLLRGCTLCT